MKMHFLFLIDLRVTVNGQRVWYIDVAGFGNPTDARDERWDTIVGEPLPFLRYGPSIWHRRTRDTQ